MIKNLTEINDQFYPRYFINYANKSFYFSGELTDQIDKQFNTYSFIEPKIIHTRHKREIGSTKISAVSKYFLFYN